ncbi:MAG TPA: SDR family oxidoreductase [Candidatus Corynebacterium gallistercoris]|uniref:SDR family oxidoreductase n=1 Tax=Candidatus Corynebacterium gallistercoris TaxID=2838530 RepID=A0A9D1RXQ0_9CORY|nr:SDR family oxidoreductase [Candidatus Corynebacterium gallistercoris]
MGGKLIVITGAASGIGRALALNFAAEGTRLYLSDRNGEGLAETAAEARARGAAEVVPDIVDVSDLTHVTSWADTILATGGVPDEIHHVAGVASWGDPRTYPQEKWRRVIDINLFGSVHMVQAFSKHIATGPRKRKDRRKFVFVSSAAGIIGLPWHAAYSASKGGVIAMCEVLRFDLAPFGVDVHVVAPGAVDTPLVHSIDIHGVDQTNSRVVKAKKLFQGHAVTPEKAAEKIRTGVRKGTFLITTSRDIRFGRWAQVNFPWAYAGFMRLLNRGFRWAAKG